MAGVWQQAMILTADPRQHILEEDDLTRTQLAVGSQLTLPTYSLAVVTVPEPTTLSLFVISTLLVGRRWLFV